MPTASNAVEDSAETHIWAKGVSVDFSHAGQTHRVLHNIDLSIARGGFVSLIGPSGCGKSTLLKVLAGLLNPAEGEVRVAGVAPAEAARQRRIGLVFQEATLMPWKNALDNVKLLMEVAYKDRSKADITERAWWPRYQAVYQDIVRHTSTAVAPWHVVPADHKWFARVVIGSAIVSALETLDLRFPRVDKVSSQEFKQVRDALENEGKGRASKKVANHATATAIATNHPQRASII